MYPDSSFRIAFDSFRLVWGNSKSSGLAQAMLRTVTSERFVILLINSESRLKSQARASPTSAPEAACAEPATPSCGPACLCVNWSPLWALRTDSFNWKTHSGGVPSKSPRR